MPLFLKVYSPMDVYICVYMHMCVWGGTITQESIENIYCTP